jgi:hypothetical protein
VFWGARDEEVLDWLQDEHGVTGPAATMLLLDAQRARRQAIRDRAVWSLLLSGIGMIVLGSIMLVQHQSGVWILSLAADLEAGVFALCVVVFARNLGRLWSGKMPGSVE